MQEPHYKILYTNRPRPHKIQRTQDLVRNRNTQICKEPAPANVQTTQNKQKGENQNNGRTNNIRDPMFVQMGDNKRSAQRSTLCHLPLRRRSDEHNDIKNGQNPTNTIGTNEKEEPRGKKNV